ncbi:WD repeat-containing protein [Ceratobasidium sp. AG-Ba]|nr:WD repeat-containing protein [Ceratobasidium sp. AG-Ba]
MWPSKRKPKRSNTSDNPPPSKRPNTSRTPVNDPQSSSSGGSTADQRWNTPAATAVQSSQPQNPNTSMEIDREPTQMIQTDEDFLSSLFGRLDICHKDWAKLKRVVDAIGKGASFGLLAEGVGALTSFVSAFKNSEQKKEEYRRLKTQLEAIFEILRKYDDSDASPSCMSSISELGKYERNRLWDAEKAAAQILESCEQIQNLVQHFTLETSLNTLQKIENQETETRLNRLPNSPEAKYNSVKALELGRGPCTPDTRVDILRQIYEWTCGNTEEKIYWLNGMAGTGKTTIAYSLCERLQKKNKLAASFFCARQLEWCRDVNRIIPSIVYQLSRLFLPFRRAIATVLESDSDVHNQPIVEQFKKLLVEPLVEIADKLPTGTTVVIDALDECAHKESVEKMLEALILHASKLPIKFFVTSRPDESIIHRMCRQEAEQIKREIRLHKLERPIVKGDIVTYIKAQFESRLETSKAELDTLADNIAERSGVLFIYAATVIRHVSHNNYARSKTRLDGVLGSWAKGPSGSFKALDGLYNSILSAAYDDEGLTDSDRAEMLLVLHTVICASKPLSTNAITDLLRLNSEQTVRAAVLPLLSVLQVSDEGGVVTTLHESFHDFLLDSSRSGKFYCNAAEHHTLLAELCFEQLSKQVAFNICGLESSYVFDEVLVDLEKKVDQTITQALFYACCYWDAHMTSTGDYGSLDEQLFKFLSERLLLWMEIMNLKHEFVYGIRMLHDMNEWSRRFNTIRKESKELLEDACMFMLAHSSVSVLLSTPHLYVSAMLFWADASPLGKYYKPKKRGMIGDRSTAIDLRGTRPLHTISTEGTAHCIAYSPSGRQIAVALGENIICLWDAHTGKQVGQPLQGHTGRVNSVAYSHDSAYIVSGSDDDTVRIWDAHTGKQVGQPLQGHTHSVNSVAYSHDSAYIVSGSWDNTVRIWDAHTGKQVGQPLQGHTISVMSVAYSHDSAYIVSGSSDNTVRIWDAHTGKQVGQPLQGHTGSVKSVAYSHDSAYIVSGSDDNTVRIWDAHTGKQVGQPLQAHTGPVNSVAYSHDSAYIVSGSLDNTVRIWDAHTGKQVGQPLQGHTLSVNSVAYSHDSAYIVSGSSDNTVRIWDAHTGKQVGQPLQGHTLSVYSVAYSHDSAYIVSGSDDNTVRIWDAHTGKQVGQPLQGHTHSVNSVAYSHDSAYIVSGSLDKTVRIWDAHTGKQVGQLLQGYTGWVYSVAYSHDSAYIVSGSDDSTVRIWDAHTGKQVGQPLQGHTLSVYSVAYSHDSAYIVSGSLDETVRIWDAHTGKQVGQPLQGHTSSVVSVAYSHDSAYIVSGSSDNTVRIWDAHTGKQVGQPLQGHTGSVVSVAYSHDSAYIVSGSLDRTVRIWDAHTGKQVGQPLQGHTGWVYSVAYSHDSAYIVSGSSDKAVRIWNAHTGKQVGQSLQGHTGSVNSAAYSHDSVHIASGSGDSAHQISINLTYVARPANLTDFIAFGILAQMAGSDFIQPTELLDCVQSPWGSILKFRPLYHR